MSRRLLDIPQPPSQNGGANGAGRRYGWTRLAAGLLALLVTSCAVPATQPGDEAAGPQAAARTKILTMAVSQPVKTIVHVGGPVGGWSQITELHSDGLVTSDFASRQPIGRLAENVPTLENGDLSVLPDGRMRLLFRLRKGVTWHDGTPFTAQDLVFSYRLAVLGGVPAGLTLYMESVEAPDDGMVVILYKAPFYLGTNLGPIAFWPMPRHILEAPSERYLPTGDLVEFLQLPYWTGEFVHLGPFRLTSFEPSQGLLRFEAYSGYFLGRPKIDVIEIREFTDQGTLLSNLMAGSIQITPGYSLIQESALEAKRRWDASGEGKVHVTEGTIRLLVPQFQPWQLESTIRDPRVRRAMLHALDREEISEVLSVTVAQSWLLESDPLYPGVKDGLRPFTYDPARAKAILAEVGWTVASDGSLRHSSDGRPFRTSVWGVPGRNQETALYSAYWRALGLDVEEVVLAPEVYRDAAQARMFPGWNYTGQEVIGILPKPAGGPHNNWQGNAHGWEDPRGPRLVAALETTVVKSEQMEAWKAINDFLVAELPVLPVYRDFIYTAAHKSVKAFDDIAGGASDRIPPWYGGYARNAYLWDLQG